MGNITNDSAHSYVYDADGNLITVDGGSTATYYYGSLNQRVREAPTRGTYEFVWDAQGRRVSNWLASNHSFVESNAYTDTSPIAFRAGGQRDYEQQNWLGTERLRTNYSGGVAQSLSSLPWGDGISPTFGAGAVSGCVGAAVSEGANWYADLGCGWSLFEDLKSLLDSGPHFHGSLQPRPSGGWDGNFGESLGIPTFIPQGIGV